MDWNKTRGGGKKKARDLGEVITLEEAVNIPFELFGMAFKVENLGLDSDEQKKVANSLRRVAKAYPNIGKSKLVKSLEKSAPILSAGITLALVIAPRVVYVRNIRNVRNAEAATSPERESHPVEAARGDDVRSGTDASASPVSPQGNATDVRGLFGRDA